ncbi:WD40/YVTN/BNR-like repeat-containing protein [Alteribacter populi]|uniref:WD40/YVTN/BNR-like repeat-containing protein n=1 Tax=Alteribacter populi TaxID=2011011 RepID=UPI000BBA4324|nr:hypothetical protein [Alteribacter populi]
MVKTRYVKGRIEYLDTETKLHDDRRTVGAGTRIDVRNYDKVILKVDKCTRATLQPRVSETDNNSDWSHKKATNIWTGTELEAIYNIGEYVVDVSGYSYFQCNAIYVQHEVHSSVTVRAVATNKPVQVSEKRHQKHFRPKPLQAEKEVHIPQPDSGTFFATDITDDTIYGYYRRVIVKTTDGGQTFTELFNRWEDDSSPYPTMVKKLNDGKVMAGYNNGEVYKMEDAANVEPELVLQMPVGRIGIDSIDIHENLVLLGEYGLKVLPNNSRRVWISTDHGDTFEKIFEEAPRDDYHIHSVKYDPYQDIIWLAVGDTINSNVYWSIDRGKNWSRVYEWGECPNQWTAILPLANCVLFLSDNRHTSVYKWDRNRGIEDSISSHRNIEIEIAYTISREVFDVEPVAHFGCTDYDNSAAYFGFIQLNNARYLPSVVYGTADGDKYYPVCIDHEIPSVPSGGIRGVAGPNSKGEIVTTVVDGEKNKIVVIKVPEWIEI